MKFFKTETDHYSLMRFLLRTFGILVATGLLMATNIADSNPRGVVVGSFVAFAAFGFIIASCIPERLLRWTFDRSFRHLVPAHDVGAVSTNAQRLLMKKMVIAGGSGYLQHVTNANLN